MKRIQVMAGQAVPELALYTRLNERQLKRYNEPKAGLFICESIRVIERALAVGYEPVSLLIEDTTYESVQKRLTIAEDCPVYVADHAFMRALTGHSLTGGVLCAMRRRERLPLSAMLDGARRLVLLDDVENPTNVGAIFRSAAALGVDGVLLTDGCSDPLYRRCARVSMGTVFQVPWRYLDEGDVRCLQASGFCLIGLALDEKAVLLDDECLKQSEKLTLVLGNEDHGISPELAAACERLVMIPMENGVDSLNVAAAAAVAFWELRKR